MHMLVLIKRYKESLKEKVQSSSRLRRDLGPRRDIDCIVINGVA